MFKHIGKRSKLSRKRKIGGLTAFALAAVLGLGAYAFTAAAEVPEQRAGAGEQTVGGYKVSSPLKYTFSTDGTKMTKVTFTLNHAASDVKVALSAGAPKANTEWTDCGAIGENEELTCTFPGEGVVDAEGTQLSVAAVSHGEVVIE